MKRRTKTNPPINHQHHLAFAHAFSVFKAGAKRRLNNQKAQHNRRGERIRFTVDLEFENGTSIEATFSRTQGFRMELPGSLWSDITKGTNNPNSIRKIEPRLRAYREAFIRWHQMNQTTPLTFRSFNLVIAALAYDQTIPS